MPARYMKRQTIPKNWGLPRKGTKYVAAPASGDIPVLVVLRDLLGIAQNRKEIKKAIHEKQILVNNKIVIDDRKGLSLFDSVSIVPMKKHYRLSLNEKGKFELVEIKEAEANTKVAKIVDKKILKGKKVQLNLSDGRNFIVDKLDCKTEDSVVINFKDKKIEKCLPLKEKAKVVVFGGKHAGETGVIEKLKLERKMVSVVEKDKKANVLIKQIMVVE